MNIHVTSLTHRPTVQIDRKTLKIVEDEVYDDISLEDLLEGFKFTATKKNAGTNTFLIQHRITRKYTTIHYFELRGSFALDSESYISPFFSKPDSVVETR